MIRSCLGAAPKWVIMALAACLCASVFAAGPDRNLVVAGSKAAPAERRVALVVGNGSYKNAPLRNPVHDAEAVAKTLQRLGFHVTLKLNQDRLGLAQAIRDFGNQLKGSNAGLFYYAGHGMQVKGRNYLIPVDADIQVEDEVPYRSIDANEVLAKMETSRNPLNVVILDACRNNPFARSFRSNSQGLAQMDAPSGTLLAFATSPGSVASDGSGSNGLYTKHLLTNLDTPGLAIEQMFKRVRISVMKDTVNKQIPWESSSLVGDFYFNVSKPAPAPPPTVTPAPTVTATTTVTTAPTVTPTQVALAAPAPLVISEAVATLSLPKTGDTWTYRYLDGWRNLPESRLVYSVSDVLGAEIRETLTVDSKPVDEQAYTSDAKLIEREFIEGHPMMDFSPYLLAFHDAAKKRMEWEKLPYLSSSPSAAFLNSWQLSGKILGKETVTVPAGTFQAVKARITGQRNPRHFPAQQESTQVIHTVWYAPEVKRIVKMTSDLKNPRYEPTEKDIFELVSYKLR